MSIIYDALKKAQETIDIGSKVQVAAKERHSKSNVRPYLLYTLAVCLVLFLGNIVLTASREPAKPSALPVAKKPDVTPPPVVQEAGQAQPQPLQTQSVSDYKKEAKESFVLNGIFFAEDQGYALINNHIVKAGDAVDEAIVKQISQDEVELEVSGKTVKLSTRDIR